LIVPVRISSDAASSAGVVVHDLALTALLGGNLFGRVAMNPALEDVCDKAERGKVLNRAWSRYGTVNSLALAALVASWLRTRRNTSILRMNQHERNLVLAKDVAVGAVVVTGLAAAAGGVGFAHQAPGGAVPMASGHAPAPETPARAARLKRAINLLGTLNILAELALATLNALLTQQNARPQRPRKLRRRR
jgi:hypothetical protein